MIPWLTVPELRDYIGDQHIENEPKLFDALNASCYHIASAGGCNRRFDKDTVASARQFYAVSTDQVYIDDAVSITTVKADVGDSGTYDQTWTTADWDPEPLNGVGPNGVSGWPVTSIRSVGMSLRFPIWGRRPQIEVTAVWGWPAVPAPIRTATLQLADRLFRLSDAGLGIIASDEVLGVVRVSRQIAGWADLIAPYGAYGAAGAFVV